MSFNPSLPVDGSLMVAAQMRDQLTGLDFKFSSGLSGTAQNPNMSTLNIPLSDPPTRPEVQQIIDAFNMLLNQITRV